MQVVYTTAVPVGMKYKEGNYIFVGVKPSDNLQEEEQEAV